MIKNEKRIYYYTKHYHGYSLIRSDCINILETFDYQYKEFRQQVYDNFDAAWDKGINNPDKVEHYLAETMRW